MLQNKKVAYNKFGGVFRIYFAERQKIWHKPNFLNHCDWY